MYETVCRDYADGQYRLVHKALEKLGKKFILFQKKQMELLQNNYLLNLERISLDPHFISYYGNKKSVPKNWDARRRYLHEGYRSLYAYDINSGSCFYALWIKEHYKRYQKLDVILKKIIDGLTSKNKIRELYIDREFYCFRDLRMIGEKYGLDFTITTKNSKKLEKWLSKIDGRKCGYYKNSRGKRIKVGLIEIPSGEYNENYPYKLTLIGFEDKSKKKKKTFGYLSSIPIDRYGPTQLGKLAKSRWHQENYFKEVLHQQGHDKLPSTDDEQIKGHLAMEMLGHNIIQLLKKDLPNNSKLKRAELKTFKIKLFRRIAKIITTPNRITINFIKYFLEQRNLPFITKKYDRDLLKLFNDRRLCFKLPA